MLNNSELIIKQEFLLSALDNEQQRFRSECADAVSFL